jgi:hypothetical protein
MEGCTLPCEAVKAICYRPTGESQVAGKGTAALGGRMLSKQSLIVDLALGVVIDGIGLGRECCAASTALETRHGPESLCAMVAIFLVPSSVWRLQMPFTS